jgi:hypothetical protein
MKLLELNSLHIYKQLEGERDVKIPLTIITIYLE